MIDLTPSPFSIAIRFFYRFTGSCGIGFSRLGCLARFLSRLKDLPTGHLAALANLQLDLLGLLLLLFLLLDAGKEQPLHFFEVLGVPLGPVLGAVNVVGVLALVLLLAGIVVIPVNLSHAALEHCSRCVESRGRDVREDATEVMVECLDQVVEILVGSIPQELSHASILFIHKVAYGSPMMEYRRKNVLPQDRRDWALINDRLDSLPVEIQYPVLPSSHRKCSSRMHPNGSELHRDEGERRFEINFYMP
ncbi:MAG: hypothetical protein BYD32DRAFT_2547, partial [Podila humilis]